MADWEEQRSSMFQERLERDRDHAEKTDRAIEAFAA
jgi:hypothetical protein